jgi:hypothetical protein
VLQPKAQQVFLPKGKDRNPTLLTEARFLIRSAATLLGIHPLILSQADILLPRGLRLAGHLKVGVSIVIAGIGLELGIPFLLFV